ncbi:MAG: LysR family transcriptional regulator, partial [Oscillospiraceae bacterium]
MNIQQMRYVLEVEKTGSITKAANNLFMGQPNLSKTIKDLENELGINIFKRTPKGVEPTAKGGEFLSYAKHIVSQIDELESLYHNEYENSININISVPRSTYIGAAFSKFLNDNDITDNLNKDRLQLHYKETNASTAISDVISGESEIGIIRYQEPYEEYFLTQLKDHNLDYKLIKQYTLNIIMSENHPLAALEEIPFHELSSYIEIVH